jgi:uncharacterized membrane protein YraQ (UPF0718 family)
MEEKSCSCDPRLSTIAPKKDWTILQALMVGGLVLAAWWLVYDQLAFFSHWLTTSVLGLTAGSALALAVEFFLYDTPKVLMLLALIVFAVGVVRTFFTPERTRAFLVGKREFVGNILAAALGIVTPFCSCSAVPLFIGFVTAGVPLGVTFSFLVSSPMINEVAVILLFGLFGWQVALLYVGTGLVIAIAAGWVIGRLKMERYVEDWVYQSQLGESQREGKVSWQERIRFGLESVKEIVGKVWPYVLLGIAVGAAIHGWVPESFMASIMGKGAWWSVPLAVLIGVPLYSNAAGFIPVLQALLEKGAALGTTLAFMMATIGLSLPETIILRKVLKPRLIGVFLGVVAVGIMIVGYLFNLVM